MNYEFVFDTYAWIEFFNGSLKGETAKELLEEGSVAMSIVVLAELSDKFAREKLEIDQAAMFLRANAVILPLSENIALEAGRLKQRLRAKSKNISLADAIHFQTAKSVNARLVTGDPDFAAIDSKDVIFLQSKT